MTKIYKIAMCLLTLTIGTTSMVQGVSANEDIERYYNEDLNITTQRSLINNQSALELEFEATSDENVVIDKITLDETELEVEKQLDGGFKYKSVVGTNGNYKFTVHYSKTVMNELSEEKKVIERKDTFTFDVAVDSIREIEDTVPTESTPADIDTSNDSEPVITGENVELNDIEIPLGETEEVIKELETGEVPEIEAPELYNQIETEADEMLAVDENGRLLEADGKGRSIAQNISPRTDLARAGYIVSKQGTGYKYDVHKISDPSYVYGNYEYALLSVNGEHAICLDPSVMVNAIEYSATNDFNNLSSAKRERIKLIGNYGYQYHKTERYILAETTLIWREMDWATDRWYTDAGATIDVSAEIAEIERLIASDKKRPSFHNTTIEVMVDQLKSVTDSNGIISEYTVVDKPSGLDVSISGNKLNLTAKNGEVDGDIVLKRKTYVKGGQSVIFKAPGSQDLVVARIADPTNATVKVKVMSQEVRFQKTDFDTNTSIGGAKFRVSTSNAVDSNGLLSGKHWDYTGNSDGYTRYIIFNDPGTTYYYQEISAPHGYIVDKTVKSFKVTPGDKTTFTIKNKVAQGQIQLIKSDQHGMKLQGVSFEVKNDKGAVVDTIVTGIDGIAKSKLLPLGNYTAQEVKVPTGVVLDKQIHKINISYVNDTTPVVMFNKNITDKYQRTDVTLTKIENDWDTTFPENNGQLLSGAQIDLFAAADVYEGTKLIASKGTKVASGTTNTSGTVTFKNLSIGEYYAKEVKAPTGFVLFDGQWNISVKYAADKPTVEVVTMGKTVDNQVIYGNALLIKQNGANQLLKDAVFGVYTKDGKLIEELTTDKKGMIKTRDLRYGDYYFLEHKAPIGHQISKDKHFFTVSEHEETIYLTTANAPIKAKIFVHKFDEETNLPLEGAKFKIFSVKDNDFVSIQFQQGKEIITKDEWTTDEDGEFLLEAFLPYGQYKLIETEAPEGYVIMDPMDFAIDDNSPIVEIEVIGEVLNQNVGNRPIRSDVAIAKLDKDTKEYLANFEFKLTDLATGDTLTGKTGDDGIYTFEKIKYGMYQVEEINVDGEYIIDRAPQFVNITEDSIVYEVTFENEKPKGNVTFTKSDIDTGDKLAGAVYHVWNDDLTFDVEVTTGANGTFTLLGLDLGDYHYQEIKAPENYLIDNEIYDFSVKYVDMDTPIISLSEERTNEQFKGEFSFTKLDEKTKEVLEGATYEITYPNGDKVEMTTDKDGQFKLVDLLHGTYTYQEIKAPNGYAIDKTVYEFEVKYVDQNTPLVYVSAERTNKTNLTQIYKFDKNTGDPLIAEFDIVKINDDGSREVIKTVKTDKENGGVAEIEKLDHGKYVVIEKWVEKPYVINPENKEQELIITQNEAKYTIKYENTKALGEVTVIKNADTGELVPGAKYGIYKLTDGKRELVQEKVTDDKGQIVFDNLELGKYEVQEIEAPIGYLLDDTVYAVNIEYKDADTPVIKVTLNVTDIKDVIPPAGVTPSRIIPAGVFVLALGTLVSLISSKRAKKVENETTTKFNEVNKIEPNAEMQYGKSEQHSPIDEVLSGESNDLPAGPSPKRNDELKKRNDEAPI